MIPDDLIPYFKELFDPDQRPDCAQRQIVFWYDVENHYKLMVEEGEDSQLPGVQLVKLEDNNSFALKKRIEYDEPTTDFLVYVANQKPKPESDWLLNISYYSKSFRSDFSSLELRKLDAPQTDEFREVIRQYQSFFTRKTNVNKLKKLKIPYTHARDLERGIQKLLADVPKGDDEDIFIALMVAEMDRSVGRENEVINRMRQFGNLTLFGEFINKMTNYECGDLKETPLDVHGLVRYILLTAFAEAVPERVLERDWYGMYCATNEQAKTFCFSIVRHWEKDPELAPKLFEYCRELEEELHLPQVFDHQVLDDLISANVFPAVDESILRRLFKSMADGSGDQKLIREVLDERRTSGWYSKFSHFYSALDHLESLCAFADFHGSDVNVGVREYYLETGYLADSHYRHFLNAMMAASNNTEADQQVNDALKEVAHYAENIYLNYLREITETWIKTVGDDLKKLGTVPTMTPQVKFYDRYIRPLTGKNKNVIVVISDALRYEVGSELRERIAQTTKRQAEIEPLLGIFPTITKCGMAALLPHTQLCLSADMEVLVDGNKSISTEDRQKILQKERANSKAFSFNTIKPLTQAERKEQFKGQSVVYVYHNTIDAVGDKAQTEEKVVSACQEAIDELTAFVEKLCKEQPSSYIMVTADHGFLYSQKPLMERDKLSKKDLSTTPLELGRRYVLASPDTTSLYLQEVAIPDLTPVSGTAYKAFAPLEIIRLQKPGGGERYVHGGISPQEMIVPLITCAPSSKSDSVSAQPATVKLLTTINKITNRIVSLDFFQEEAICDKIIPTEYSICIEDKDHKPVSDTVTILADKRSPEAPDRMLRASLRLAGSQFDASEEYYVTVKRGATIALSQRVSIDLLITEDFGF